MADPTRERMIDVTVVLPADMKPEAGGPAAAAEATTQAGQRYAPGYSVELVDLFESPVLIADGEYHDLATDGRVAYSYRYLIKGTPRP